MANFLAETYTPESVAVAELASRVRSSAGVPVSAAERPRYLRSILVPADEMCFHLFEAPSADVVRDVLDRAGLPADRIVEAQVWCDAREGRDACLGDMPVRPRGSRNGRSYRRSPS